MGKKEKTTAEIRKIRVLEKAFQDIEEITDFIAIAKQQPLVPEFTKALDYRPQLQFPELTYSNPH